jgi:fumarate reductase flavoprotein subunit
MPIDAADVDWDVSTEVLVVGGGGAGLLAALRAIEHDVVVTVIEKEDELGGTTAMSGGTINAAGTRYQSQAGVDDSPTALAEDIINHNRGEVDESLVFAVAQEARRTVHWLSDEHGWDFHYYDGPHKRSNHTTNRTHWVLDDDGDVVRPGGRYIVDSLSRALKRSGGEIVTNTPMNELVIDDGEVVGVTAGKNVTESIRAKAVLLATGGFSANLAMREEYCPETVDMLYHGNTGNTGDGIRAGLDLGAAIDNMAAYLGYALHAAPENLFVPWEITVSGGGIVVTETGDRFCDESTLNYSELVGRMIDVGSDAYYLVFDDHVDQVFSSDESMDRYRRCVDNNVFTVEQTPEVLAAAFDVDPDRLGRSVSEKKDTLDRSIIPPFYGTRVRPAIYHTQGGLRVDTSARVLRPDGTPLPNLYAGGGAAVGLSGNRPEGYLSGNGLLAALNLGSLMGASAGAVVGNR